MGAFILAALVFAGTVALSILVLFGSAMSDNPSNNSATGVVATFVTGSLVSLAILASHWMPSIGW